MLLIFFLFSATIAQALSGNGPALSLIGVLVFWRIIMGLGSEFLYFSCPKLFVSSSTTRRRRDRVTDQLDHISIQSEEITPSLLLSLQNSLLLEFEDE